MKFVLENIRSAWNVGSILRTADALGMEVVLVGYTPRPVGTTLPMVAKTAIGAEKTVVWEHFTVASEVLDQYPQALHLGIEISPSSRDIFEFIREGGLKSLAERKNLEPDQIPEQTFLWLGNEISGLPQSLIQNLDAQLHLPMKGQKESLNVSSCACAVGYLMLEAAGT